MVKEYYEIWKEYLKELRATVAYADLVKYFIGHFNAITLQKDLIPQIRPKVLNITDTPLGQLLIDETSLSHKRFIFLFKEDDRFDGMFDLDFIDDFLVNFRAQLFVRGLFGSGKLKAKWANVRSLMEDMYGKSLGRMMVYDDVWHDNVNGLIVCLRKGGGFRIPSYISFTITKEKFAQSAMQYIVEAEARRL